MPDAHLGPLRPEEARACLRSAGKKPGWDRRREGPRSAQPVSNLIRALSWRSQSTDSIVLSLLIRPRQRDRQTSLPLPSTDLLQCASSQLGLPASPRAILGTVGRAGRQEGRGGESPLPTFSDLGPSRPLPWRAT